MISILGQQIAPAGINVWNPSFDITPCSLIRGIITELVSFLFEVNDTLLRIYLWNYFLLRGI
jgi:methylthioribose-1-phosphate isomerase